MRRRILGLAVAAMAWLALAPSVAHAQSAIAGTVKDESGSVLPGVTVDASSEALIEKTRTAVTDGQGQYKIIDLRPGTYSLTFSLTGFQSVKHDGVNLPAEFTATINADMKVGSLQETITVTGDTPTVDVQSAAHTQRIDREIMDSLPTARTIQSVGQLVVGVNLSLPDVGGSRSIMQTYMSVHGQSAANNTVLVDGIQLNGLEADGLVQSYFNDAMIQEMSYQTSGIGADTATGGVRLNMIPKDGGNRFSGSATGSYRPQKWQSTNLTPRVATAGVIYPNSTNVTDGSASLGGPILKDKLWFLVSARDLRTTNGVLNTYKTPSGQTNLFCIQEGRAGRPTCGQGDDFNELKDVLVRTTYQVSQRNKVSLMYDRINKYRAHDMQSNYDPETAANVWTSPNYATGSIKWTSTMSSRVLIEAGYGLNNEYRNVAYEPGIGQTRWSSAWYSVVSQATAATALGLVRQAAPNINQQWPKRSSYMAAASYVTGSHNVKAGLSGTWGKFFHSTDANGDLQALFSDSNFTVPAQVTVRNTPLQAQEKLNSDIGLFIQDTWTMKRLTLAGGLRWQHLNASVTALSSPAGRFVPGRQMPTDIPNLPNWNSLAPRVQAVYDLFGNARTAVKASFNRYDVSRTTGIASTFNPLSSKTATINWTDVNGDGVPQGARYNPDGSLAATCSYPSAGCELDLANLASNFGQLSDAGSYGGYPRPYIYETGLEVQHELMKRLSVTGTYFHGSYNNQTTTYNSALTNNDFTPVQVFNPIDGSPITVYNRIAATAPATANITVIDPDYKRIYSSFSAEFRLRFAKSGLLFGGLSWEREVRKDCTSARLSDPNGAPTAATPVPGLRYCDQTSNDVANGGVPDNLAVPYIKNLRLNGSYPLPWGVVVSATLQSNGFLQGATYQITGGTTATSTKYPDGTITYKAAGVAVPACPTANGCVPGGFVLQTALRQGAINVQLYPASQPWERLTQVDFKLAKNFKVGKATVSPQFEAFNLNNSDKVITVASTSYANSGGTYQAPNSMVQGRLYGASVQMRW